MSLNMIDFEKELEQMVLEEADQKETPLPTIEEQKAVVAKLKELEAQGELTPEVLEAHFGQFYANNDQTIH
jgi:restriction endonuclease S subunit